MEVQTLACKPASCQQHHHVFSLLLLRTLTAHCHLLLEDVRLDQSTFLFAILPNGFNGVLFWNEGSHTFIMSLCAHSNASIHSFMKKL